ncbi:MAG: alpha/beta hydrolase [Polyangiales bacterium]
MQTQVTPAPARLPSFLEAPAERIDVGHSRLAYRSCGSGPDLVLVHGWPLHAGTFRALLPALAQHFTCHLLDLPGAGFTESRHDAPLDLASHAVALRSAIDQLCLGPYSLLAHDSGGAIARLVAAEDPRVTRMVLGPTEIPGHHPALIAMLQAVGKIPGAPALLRRSMKWRWLRQSSLCFGSAFADPSRVEGEFFSLFLAPLFASWEAFRMQFRFLRNLDQALVDRMPDVHARILAPTLLIWGDDDPTFPVAKARALPAQFGGDASFVSLPRSKTFVHEEQPEAFLRHALPFLTQSTNGRTARRSPG